MDIPSPDLHDLSSPTARELRNLPNLRLSEWEIGVTSENHLVWSIVLAYLNSCHEEKDLARRIRNIVSSDTIDMKDVENRLKKCNPFLNDSDYFRDELLQHLVETFHFRIILLCLDPQCTNDKLKAASHLLLCNIVIIWKHSLNVSEFTRNENLEYYDDTITLYYSEQQPRNTFSFGLDKSSGICKQLLALFYILNKETVMENVTLIKICKLPDIRENFVIALLRNNRGDIITNLFKSSRVIKAIAHAGFKTDPKLADSDGHSAFYYAVTTGADDISYLLYNYAANSCRQSDCSFRSPRYHQETDINFKLLSETLITVRNKIKESYTLNADQAFQCALKTDALCRLNLFHIEISNGFIAIIRQFNSYGYYEELSDAEKRKQIILFVLEKYEKFFQLESSNSPKQLLSFFDCYIKYSGYFNNLDVYAAFLFFDNSFSLKERLPISGNQYLKTESQFFLFIFCSNFFSSMEDGYFRYLITEKNIDFSHKWCKFLHVVSFLKRVSLQKQLRQFRNVLHEIILREDNVLRCLPTSEVKTLTDLPIIEDQFLIVRMRHYIKTATQVSVTDKKSILVIQRALQVLGESLKWDGISTNCIKYLLNSVLPFEVVKSLIDIRENLSHLSIQQISRRNLVDNDVNFFKDLQTDLKVIEDTLYPVFAVQNFRQTTFLNSLAFTSVRIAKRKESWKLNELQSLLGLFPMTEQLNSIDEVETKEASTQKEEVNACLKTISRSLSNFFYQTLQKSQLLLDCKPLKCKIMFEKVLFGIKNVLQDDMLKHESTSEVKELLNDRFIVLEVLLNFIVTDTRVEASEKRKLLKNIKLRRKLYKKKSSKGTNSNELVSRIKNILRGHEKSMQNILSAYEVPKNFISSTETSFSCIYKLDKTLRDISCFTEQEIQDIQHEASKNFEEVLSAKRTLVSSLTEGNARLTPGELTVVIEKLRLSKTKSNAIAESYEEDRADLALPFINSATECFDWLLEAIQTNEVDKKKYDSLCDKLNLSESSRETLGKLVKGQREKVRVNKLQFLRNKIHLLQMILIEEQANIKDLWYQAKSYAGKQLLHEKIVQLYMCNFEVQAAVETLLFDCMNILERKGLKYLWKKTSNLFNGINLRNVLGHGNPLYESIGKLLDPNDLPSELIREMIVLIKDGETIDVMLKLLSECNDSKFEFNLLMNYRGDHKNKQMCDVIKECDRWKDYAYLIPDQKKH